MPQFTSRPSRTHPDRSLWAASATVKCGQSFAIAVALSAAITIGGGSGVALAQVFGCQAPTAVCDSTDLVVSVRAGETTGSAVQIEAGLFVTARHIVRARPTVTLVLKGGKPLEAEVIPTSYPGDLALVAAPEVGNERPPIPLVGAKALRDRNPGALFAVSADPASGAARVSPAGRMIAAPAESGIRPRLFHSAPSTFGDSGGALMDSEGRLTGFVIAGGEGRNEAIPASEIAALRASTGPSARDAAIRIGGLYETCVANLDRSEIDRSEIDRLTAPCIESDNRQLMDVMAQTLGRAGLLAEAADLFRRSLDRDPNALNARVGLVATLIAQGNFPAAVPEVRTLLGLLPEDPGVLRQAIPVAKWGAAPDIAVSALATLDRLSPDEAAQARGFLDADIPAPGLRR